MMRGWMRAGVAAIGLAGGAQASEVARVPHGVVVTPDSGPAKRVRVLAYGDDRFRVSAVPGTDLEVLPKSLMVVAQPQGDPAISEDEGYVTTKTRKASARVQLSDGAVSVIEAAGKAVRAHSARGKRKSGV